MQAPSAPEPPNPYAVAAAQTASNLSTAIGNTFMGNANVDTPDGSVRYTQRGVYVLTEPTYDKDGNVTGTVTRDIPLFLRTETLSATNQNIKDSQDAVKQAMADWARTQVTQLQSVQATPFSIAGAPARGAIPAAPVLDGSAPTPGTLVRTIGAANNAAELASIQNAINDRLQWQIEEDRTSAVTLLECKGIFPGSKAYEREMLVFDRSSNDARIQALLAASKEQATRLQIEYQKATFANQVQAQEFQQRALVIDIKNGTALKMFSVLSNMTALVDAQRSTWIQEKVQERAQTINELSGLMHGGKVDVPQFQAFNPGRIDPTPVGQYVYQTAALEQQNYQTQVAQQQQMMGGLLSLGGSILSAGMMGSDPAWKNDIGAPERVIDRVDRLDIKSWRYRPEIAALIGETTDLHVGPMADQFAALFGGDGHVIECDRATRVVLESARELGISPVDVFGTALKILQDRARG